MMNLLLHMNILFRYIFSSAFIILMSLTTFGQSECTLKTDKDGIKVYTCDLEGSKFKAVRSSFQIKCTLSEFVAAVMDIDNHGDWEYKSLNTKVLKIISDHELIYYSEADAPVLTSSRDFVIQLTVNQDPQTKELIIDLVSVPDYIPHKENIVRVPFSKARYNVKALSPSLLQVDYYIEIDLGGSVAPWMVNMVADRAPYETFKDLQRVIGNYKGKGASFIKN